MPSHEAEAESGKQSLGSAAAGVGPGTSARAGCVPCAEPRALISEDAAPRLYVLYVPAQFQFTLDTGSPFLPVIATLQALSSKCHDVVCRRYTPWVKTKRV